MNLVFFKKKFFVLAPGRFFKILLLNWCFLGVFSHAHRAYKEEQFPSKEVEQASDSVWEIFAAVYMSPLDLSDKNQEGYSPSTEGGIFDGISFPQGTGFFIASGESKQTKSNHLITNCHVIRSLLRNGNSLDGILFSNVYHSDSQKYFDSLRVKRIIALDYSLDLALLEINEKIPSYLKIRDTPMSGEEDLFILGYPGGGRHLMRKIGPIHLNFNHRYSLVDHASLNGGSGSPVLDIHGEITGVAFAGRGNLISFLDANQLRDFLKGSRGVRCGTDDPETCLEKALALTHEEADEGYPPALFSLSQYYLYRQNTKKAFNLIEILANQGYVSAQLDLALMFLKGMGTEKNLSSTVNWARRSAKQGHIPAWAFLATRYLEGTGVKKDKQKAFDLIKFSAEQGYAPAQLVLALMCFEGEGTEKNLPCAVDWARRSAEQNHIPAQSFFAKLHYLGEGVEKDVKQAIDWWTSAMQQGDDEAEYSLALLMYFGEGMNENKELAFKWMESLAGRRGYAPAQKFLEELSPLEKTLRDLYHFQRSLPRRF